MTTLSTTNPAHADRNAAANVVAAAINGNAWSSDGDTRKVRVYVKGETPFVIIFGADKDGDHKIDWSGGWRNCPIARLRAAGIETKMGERGTFLVVPAAVAAARRIIDGVSA